MNASPDPLHSSDDDYVFRHGRASDKLKHDELTFPCRPFMSNYSSIGTPGEAARDQARRLDGLWEKCFVFALGLIVALGAVWAINTPAHRQPPPVDSSVQYRIKAARLAVNARACELDLHEGCLVCMHKDALGMPSVSTHC